MATPSPLPLVYACSGCSDVAQLANSVAVALDHRGIAEMSCISGVGGGVPGLVRKAQSGRPIVALDGCQMHCTAHCLDKAGVSATHHLRLYEQGFKKRRGRRYDDDCVEAVITQLIPIVDALACGDATLDQSDSPVRLTAHH